MLKNKWLWFGLVTLTVLIVACSNEEDAEETSGLPTELPSTEGLDPDDPMTEYIQYGEKLFEETDTVLVERVGNELSCSSCHADGGISDTISMIGVTTKYPAYRSREDVIYTIEDRINGCMIRSMNGEKIDHDSKEMRALTSYLTYVSKGYEIEDVTWLGNPAMEEIPEPSVARGDELFEKKNCLSCHATDGLGTGPRSGPALWGDGSFNDGAGMTRLSDMAGFIQHNMPRYDPGSLTDQEAADLAAYILSHERPVWESHDQDWKKGGRPTDIITQDRREKIRAGKFDWTKLENIIPAEEVNY
ncbi:c-type cytochrome [Virgibacillus sp. FSP13]